MSEKLNVREGAPGTITPFVVEEGSVVVAKFADLDKAEEYAGISSPEGEPEAEKQEEIPERYRFETFQDRKKKWRFRLISAVNGQTILSGQAYSDKDAMSDTLDPLALATGFNVQTEAKG